MISMAQKLAFWFWSACLSFFAPPESKLEWMAPLRTRKALLVGINEYRHAAPLHGCINDVKHMRRLLKHYYGFEDRNIITLLNRQATKENVLHGLVWLAMNSAPDDELVFYYSGHVSQVFDYTGDEVDLLDEVLHVYDTTAADLLHDDVLAQYFNKMHRDAYFTFICDGCHSGTILEPSTENSTSLNETLLGNKVLLSGCHDNETSVDACINGVRQGAFTWALLKALKDKYPYESTATQRIYRETLSCLRMSGFLQKPKLMANKKMRERELFGGFINRSRLNGINTNSILTIPTFGRNSAL